jgi:serpin B
VNSLPQSKKYKLSLANSIWLNSNRNFEANQNFLQTNADYYNASLYRTPFDNQTKNDINNWVNTHTDEMIPEILDRISPDALMYLINALAFEAEWHNTYNKNQVLNGDFIRSDGTTVKTDFMYSEESACLEDKNATGFIKYYYEGKYAFVALLPNENLTLSEYVATLDGEKIADLLSNPQQTVVNAAIPKFQTEYKVEMSDMLKNMGIIDAFDASKADFSKIGNSQNGSIYIDSVLHKTYISVMEKGTKAGAVTAIQIKDTCLPVETKTVHLNRPFVYMLIDCENNLPFFIGSLTDITK